MPLCFPRNLRFSTLMMSKRILHILFASQLYQYPKASVTIPCKKPERTPSLCEVRTAQCAIKISRSPVERFAGIDINPMLITEAILDKGHQAIFVRFVDGFVRQAEDFQLRLQEHVLICLVEIVRTGANAPLLQDMSFLLSPKFSNPFHMYFVA